MMLARSMIKDHVTTTGTLSDQVERDRMSSGPGERRTARKSIAHLQVRDPRCEVDQVSVVALVVADALSAGCCSHCEVRPTESTDDNRVSFCASLQMS